MHMRDLPTTLMVSKHVWDRQGETHAITDTLETD